MHLSSSSNRLFSALTAFAVFLWIIFPGNALCKNITLTAKDGYRIAATLTMPKQKPAVDSGVVLIHMYRNTKESWKPLQDELVSRGITTLAIDLRGHGQSKLSPNGADDSIRVINREPQFFNTMYLDAEAALNYLVEKLGIKPARTALVGASVGCSIAIRTALDNTVAAVVVMTPGRNYLGIPTMEHIKKWPGIPLLILTSEEEVDRGANDIYAALQDRGAELMVFQEEGIHGTNMFGEVEDIEKTIAEWLSRHLK